MPPPIPPIVLVRIVVFELRVVDVFGTVTGLYMMVSPTVRPERISVFHSLTIHRVTSRVSVMAHGPRPVRTCTELFPF